MRQSGRTPSELTPTRPIITLTTDFGLRDSYVAAMKAVLLREAPDARLIDVTHLVPRHDILCASITLERAVDGFPPGTVHLAVVDPGVGTQRRILVAEINTQYIVCPDNGLITWTWRRHDGGRAHELTWRPARQPSVTFHGRDIMAPAAARIARAGSLADLSRPIGDPLLLDIAPAPRDDPRGRIIQIDQFGNATTNIPYDHLRARNGAVEVRIKGRRIGKLKRTYWDVAPGKPLALIGSSGLLEIAVRDGSAERDLRVKVGDEVVIR
jgi:S-adenosylmethionine hydrolase